MYVIFKSGWIINHTFHLKKKFFPRAALLEQK